MTEFLHELINRKPTHTTEEIWESMTGYPVTSSWRRVRNLQDDYIMIAPSIWVNQTAPTSAYDDGRLAEVAQIVSRRNDYTICRETQTFHKFIFDGTLSRPTSPGEYDIVYRFVCNDCYHEERYTTHV